MISRAHRFHGHASLNYVYRHGKTVRRPLLAVKYLVNNRRQEYRCAVVVSRKVSKSAVVRNRIRRRLYEQVRQHEQAITKPYDIVITVFGEQLAEMPPSELAAQTVELLAEAGVVTLGEAAEASDAQDVSHGRIIEKE